MVIFFVFLLIPLKHKITTDSKFFILIMLICVFVLSPKNYIYFSGVSLEVILNPIMLITSIIFIFYKSIFIQNNETSPL